MIENPAFEGGYKKVVITIPTYWEGFVPEGWHPFFLVDKNVPHDPDNIEGYLPPEFNVIHKEPPFLDPPRIAQGEWAVKIHSMWRVYAAGLYQQVWIGGAVDLAQASAVFMGWSSNDDDSHTSEPDDNLTFSVGIDPTGGTDPWAESVRWGFQNSANDAFLPKFSLPVQPQSEVVTVFLLAECKLRYKHMDTYIDNVTLSLTGPPVQVCEGTPRVEYKRVVNVYAAGSSKARVAEIAAIAYKRGKQTTTGAYDDGGIGDLASKTAVLWDLPTSEQPLFKGFYDLYYPGTIVKFDGDAPEPDPPDPGWKPKVFVPLGMRLAIHSAGDGGQSTDIFAPLMPYSAEPDSSKIIVSVGAVRDIKGVAPLTKVIGRVIECEGVKSEWFDYNGDPIWQAENRMAALRVEFGNTWQHYDYIEIINEQKPPNAQAHLKLAQFFIRAMQIVDGWNEAEGTEVKLAIFSHSTGTPEPEDWDAIADSGVFEACAAGGHAISLHEYDINGQGGHLYRYRYLYDNIILPRHQDIPLYITEGNLDVADAKDHDKMFAFWTRYDAETAKDPYLAGIHLYSTGEVYSAYRETMYGLYGRLRDYAIAVKERVNG